MSSANNSLVHQAAAGSGQVPEASGHTKFLLALPLWCDSDGARTRNGEDVQNVIYDANKHRVCDSLNSDLRVIDHDDEGRWMDVGTRAMFEYIVACVNALAGIPDPSSLRRQRDELLALCKAAREWMRVTHGCNLLSLKEGLDAAIAACEVGNG